MRTAFSQEPKADSPEPALLLETGALAFSAADDKVSIVDVESGQLVRVVTGSQDAKFSPTGGLLATGDKGGAGR